ncbi:serine/threonine-protein kinase M1 [Quaeritorhiza haematococci]|nr:serine/threonine-protein kinase M1 [Quaeritorhiza haematococci]
MRLTPADDPRLLHLAASEIKHVVCAKSGTLFTQLPLLPQSFRLAANGPSSDLLGWSTDAGAVCLRCDHVSPSVKPKPTAQCDAGQQQVTPDYKFDSGLTEDILDYDHFRFLMSNRHEPETRVAFLNSLRSLLQHLREDPSKFFIRKPVDNSARATNGAEGGLFEDCLKPLGSALRSVRVAAGAYPSTSTSPPQTPELANDHVAQRTRVVNSNRNVIFEEIKHLLDSRKTDVHETLIMAVGNLGRVDDDILLGHVLHTLIELLGRDNVLTRAFAYEQIRRIGRLRGKPVSEICIPFLPEISIYSVERIRTHPTILREIVSLFGRPLKEFVEQTLEYTLPHLVLEEKTELIEDLSRMLDRQVPVMCVHEVHHILAYLFMQDKKEIQSALVCFLKIASSNFNNITMASLLRSCSLMLVTKLAIEMGDARESRKQKANLALRVVEAKLTSDEKSTNGNMIGTSSIDSASSLSAFLNGYILGILSHMNGDIMDSTGMKTIAHKVKIIRSLTQLMRLIGTDIHSVMPQTTLDSIPLRDSALEAWETFVRTLNIKNLGPILNQVAVILLRLHPHYTRYQLDCVIKIFRYLIIENAAQLAPHFGDLCQFPPVPDFEDIRRTIAVSQGKNKEKSPTFQLRRLLKSVAHENATVCQQALSELFDYLEAHQDFFCTQILAEAADPVISETVQVLLDTSKKYNGTRADIQMTCCECLGVLGAADPSRLDVNIVKESQIVLNNFAGNDESRQFVCQFIEQWLAPAYRAASSTMMQGHLAFAIQELLRFCGFTSQIATANQQVLRMMGADALKLRRLWDQFSKSVLESIRPLLDAKYSVHQLPPKPQTYPIYPTKSCFKEWLQAWTGDLIEKAKGARAQKIFGACRNVVKEHDVNIALSLLPHLVLNILIDGIDGDQADILKEFLSVLNDTDVGDSKFAEKRQLSTQTVFTLVDHLTKWLRLKRLEATRQNAVLAKRAGRFFNADEVIKTDESTRRVEQLMAAIPQAVMAEASYRCKAYARALMHFEQHFRKERISKTEQQLQPLYAHLQKIYANIDEPDGMEGIATKFLAPTLEQQILGHECAGKWTAAQTCYELALQEDPNNINHHVGLLKCLKNVGHMETMLTHINGTLAQHPEWESVLNSFGIEASWRLGKWSSLDRFLSRPHNQHFEAMLGRVLLAATRCLRKETETSHFYTTLRDVRNSLTAPLAAASMESYSRAYECVLKLHMLYEVEAGLREQFETNNQHLRFISLPRNGTNNVRDEDFIERILRIWESRLKITTASFRVREPILNLRRILLDKLR